MNGDTIKSFLIGLGFSVDESTLSKFNKSIQQASIKVLALYASVKVMSAGVFSLISGVAKSFEEFGYEARLIAPAINKTLMLRRELLKAYGAAGISITKVVQESVKFNLSLTKTQYAFKAIYSSVAAKFFPMLTKQMDIFRGRIYANMPKIQMALEKFVLFIFKAFEATTQLGSTVFRILSRIYDFFYKLHQQTDGWSTIILGVVAAWKLLNLSFLATPLGMLLAGLLAILALYDDFIVWKEGGKSFFDWSYALPIIEAATKGLKAFRSAAESLMVVFIALFDVFVKIFQGNWSKALDSFKIAIETYIEYLAKLFSFAKPLMDLFKSGGSHIAEGLGRLFGGGTNAAANTQSVLGGSSLPLGVNNNTQNNSNLNVSQQTSISVSAGADSGGIGQSIAAEQTRINFDMVRNLKGAVR